MLGGSEEGDRRFEDFVGSTQLRDLATQPFHRRGLPGGHFGKAAGVDFGRPYPLRSVSAVPMPGFRATATMAVHSDS
jgi:hypothetical protein